jgi:hypothetical protein
MNNNIIETLTRIETKLDEVIAALHAYDDNELHCEYSGLPSVKAYEKVAPCRGHNKASWDDEEEANKRMDIIGQNGNEGSHYVTNEEADEDAKFNDYGMRVVDRDKDNNNKNKGTQPKQKQYYKNKRSKRAENKK